jgi:DNA-binding GntR family transcriptional regulator
MISKTEAAYCKIRDAITYGGLKPREALVESKICKLFNVGRTPLREALRQLKMEGYVDIISNKGAVVTEYSLEDVEAIYNIIAIMESYATKLATATIDTQTKLELDCLQEEIGKAGLKKDYRKWLEKNALFHGIFYKFAGNIHLTKAIINFRDKIYRYRFIAITIPGHIEQCMQDHETILKFVSEENSKMAGEAMERHVLYTKSSLLEFLKRSIEF